MSDSFQIIFRERQEISTRYDVEHEAIWCYFNPKKRPCFSSVLLREANEIQHAVINYFKDNGAQPKYPVRYLILASQTPGVFNFGGDLNLFVQLIVEQNREQLFEYAKSCIDICYLNAVNLHLPLTTISLVEGTALGGGFESALSSNVVIAEKQAQMGCPEIRFNLFPGMGAYSFLARILGMKKTEKILQGGKVYTAAEMYDMGIVDVLAETGEGGSAVNQFIKKHRRTGNGMRAIKEVGQFYSPISYEELIGITKIWVDAALRLTRKDLRTMERLVTAQNSGNYLPDMQAQNVQFLRTKQDRRISDDHPEQFLAEQQYQTDRRVTTDRRIYN